MKPKDLKPPTDWNQRRVVIADRVWYVPDYFQDYAGFNFPGWSSSELFGNDHPVVVEYCSGNGTWIANKAAELPELNWVGVEKRFERVRKIWAKIRNTPLSNLIALCGEAYTATHHYFPTESIDEAYVNFPDPWPKARHAKHRLIQPQFLDDLYRVLKTEGVIQIVTDDVNYSNLIIEVFAKHPGFSSCYPDPSYITDLPGYGVSFFENLWREKGKTIRYHKFQKQIPQ